ncbi:unnamed protein product, partial [Gulo gulo]
HPKPLAGSYSLRQSLRGHNRPVVAPTPTGAEAVLLPPLTGFGGHLAGRQRLRGSPALHSPPSHSSEMELNIINPLLNRACTNHMGGYKANKMRKGAAGKERVDVRIRTQQKEIKHFKIYSRYEDGSRAQWSVWTSIRVPA